MNTNRLLTIILPALLAVFLVACDSEPGEPAANAANVTGDGRPIRLHVGDAMTVPAVRLSHQLEADGTAALVEVDSLAKVATVRSTVKHLGSPVSDLSLQLFGPVSDVSPEEEAEQAIRMVEALEPEGTVWLFQTWTDGGRHWDEMNQSWDAQAWSDRTDEAIYDHQNEVYELLVEEYGEDKIALIPGGRAMLAVNDAILGAGQDSPYYNVSDLIADFGMSRNLSRTGIYFMGLVHHAATHGGELPEELPENPEITADYLDPAKAEVALTPAARQMFHRVVREVVAE
jgi:hypothetical protein